MKTSPLLSRFSGGSMRIGAAGRKHAVRQVDMRYTDRQFRKLRLSFRAPDGRTTDLEMNLSQAWSFFEWGYAESIEPNPGERQLARELARIAGHKRSGGPVAVPPA